jgi:uncharacterized protein with von Willebrand factor type A (vWA) domain
VPEPAADPAEGEWSPASAMEVLRRADIATLEPHEVDEVHRLVEAMRVDRPTRRSRRRRPVRHGTRGPIDLRRTSRRALRDGGETLHPVTTRPATIPRRLVLLLDVSGSMEPYARALLRFAHAAARGERRVEVFALGTRLTRLTRELAVRDPDEALRRATARLDDWAGGTRLGETVRTFNQQWGARGVARGATVVILSDGWDRGDPQLLGQEMARLHRLAHRIIWVNPLVAGEGYEPLARGMAAALPHVDELVAGHSFDALAELAAVVVRGRR